MTLCCRKKYAMRENSVSAWHVIALTGTDISAESGIPTSRALESGLAMTALCLVVTLIPRWFSPLFGVSIR